MFPKKPNERGSTLLVEECFSTEDPGFIAALRQVHSPKFLAAFAERWKRDGRPWARRQIFAYLEEPFDSPGHQPLVKRLFKHAEATGDHELMALFAVGFDTLVRRVRANRWRWDLATRSAWQEEALVTPRNVIDPEDAHPPYRQPRGPQGWRLFSYRTRFYLRRRAWRYFRQLGFRQPGIYPAAVARLLQRYQDADLASGENILDSWVLLNACFFSHDALLFGTAHVVLKENRTLAELTPAPRFPELWAKPESAPLLLNLVVEAGAHLVRLWAMQLFRNTPAARASSPDAEMLFRLLDHEDEVVQQFGAELLGRLEGLGREPIGFWLRLLQTQNIAALSTLCEAFRKHVGADRLDLHQCIALATARTVPVARLGEYYLTLREIRTEADRKALTALADARCPSVAGALARWALDHVGMEPHYTVEAVSRFFDSLLRETREAAWDWLMSTKSPGYSDPVLWSRLTETPFDDLRLRLIDCLEKRTVNALPDSTDLGGLWCAVLLGVHRGGKQKAKAVRQIGEAIVNDPTRLPALLPVLAVAVRSVRLPEMRAGLATVIMMMEKRPELADQIQRSLPELVLGEKGGWEEGGTEGQVSGEKRGMGEAPGGVDI